ncbi:MAG TPA: hypothetical protein VF244_04330 [Acidimicrobiales bacterium]
MGRLVESDWQTWQTEPLPLPLFAGTVLPIDIVNEGGEGPLPDDLAAAARAFLTLPPSILRTPAVLDALVRNYEEAREFFCPEPLPITTAADLWDHVMPIGVTAEWDEEGTPYLVVECNCDWEPEHGLALAFRRGRRLTRLSESDGHVTGRGEL